jgi:hypothetical protein
VSLQSARGFQEPRERERMEQMVIVGSNPRCRLQQSRPPVLMRVWIWLTPNLTQYQRSVRLRVLTLSSIFVVVLVLIVVKVIIKASKAA